MSTFIRPLQGPVSSGGTFADHKARHSVNPGVDYAVGTGTAVHAVAPGVIAVIDPRPDGSGGRMIGLDCDNGSGVDYLHLSKIAVEVGDRVRGGQELGRTGCSANGSDDPRTNRGIYPHLHLAIRPHHTHFGENGNVDFETLPHIDADTPPREDGMQLIKSKKTGNRFVIPELGVALKLEGAQDLPHARAYSAAAERAFAAVSSAQAKILLADLGTRNEQAAEIFGWAPEKLAEIREAIAHLSSAESDDDDDDGNDDLDDLAQQINAAITEDIDEFVAQLKARIPLQSQATLSQLLAPPPPAPPGPGD